MGELGLAILIKGFFALLVMLPGAYVAYWVHNKMKPGRLKSILLKRIN